MDTTEHGVMNTSRPKHKKWATLNDFEIENDVTYYFRDFFSLNSRKKAVSSQKKSFLRGIPYAPKMTNHVEKIDLPLLRAQKS